MKGLSDRKEIKDTAGARKVVQELEKYRSYFRVAQGKDPERIHISIKQKQALGIDAPFEWLSGIKLQLVTDKD